MRLLSLFFIISLPLFGEGGPCEKVSFVPGSMDEGLLTTEFKSSILRLQVPGSSNSGTGYLIDSNQGYIITAFHVVASAKVGTLIDITTSNPGLAGAKLTASLIKALGTIQSDGTVGGIDLALLKLTNPSLATGLRPVDISLRFPTVDQTLYAMGYPQLGNEPNTTFSEQLVRFMANHDGSIQVTQAIFGGNSGGPLLDSSGNSIGTCFQAVGTGSAVARYIPMCDAKVLLDLVPMSERMISLDQKIREGTVTEATLMDILTKSTSNPTNVELYAWARHFIANRDQYRSPEILKLIGCPIKALMHRGMDDLILDLNVANSEVAAEANIHVAERMIARGRPLEGADFVHAAAALFAETKNTAGTFKAAILSTRIQLAVGSIDAASIQSKKVMANIDSLSKQDKLTALSTAASIDIVKGNKAKALPKLEQASHFAVDLGQLRTAAVMMSSSADVSLNLSKPGDAKNSLLNAIALYQLSNDTIGEAETVYKLIGVESILKNPEASKNLKSHYIAIAPHGTHAEELNWVIAESRHPRLDSVIQ